MNEVKPIKRSAQLQPLSREHHDGLLFVWKIRQGLNNTTSIDKLREYTVWYWRHHIKPHFFQEEKVLLPFIPPSHPMVLRLKEEHDYIRELILAIDKDAEVNDFIHLSNLIETHIRFEEREVFQYLEEHLSGQQLTEIYDLLEKHPVFAEDNPIAIGWKDEFWVNKN